MVSSEGEALGTMVPGRTSGSEGTASERHGAHLLSWHPVGFLTSGSLGGSQRKSQGNYNKSSKVEGYKIDLATSEVW